MSFSRRQFVGTAALAMLGGCARVKQSPIGRMAADIEFGGDGVVKVAAIGGLQIEDARSVGAVGRAVNQINNDADIDFTVVVGDLTRGGTLPQMNLAHQALARLEKPYFCLPGERDLNNALEDPYDFYRRVFNKTQWRTNSEGWAFIGLDTCASGVITPAVPEDRLAWLANQLKHADKKKPLALFTHHPLFPAEGNGAAAESDAILSLFSAHNLRLVVSGHVPVNRAEEHDGVLFATSGSCGDVTAAEDDNVETGFRLLTLDGSTISQEFVAAD